MVRIALLGVTGRMGRQLLDLVNKAEDLELVGASSAEDDPAAGRDVGELTSAGKTGVVIACDAATAVAGADVAVDFTLAPAAAGHARAAADAGCCLVIGTTGLDDESKNALETAAASIGVVCAPNMSPGMNVLYALAGRAAGALDESYQAKIRETHHHHKIDAPSGSALRLAEVFAAARPRSAGKTDIESIREGDVIGEHSLILTGEGECLTLTHRVTDRRTFALGALRAARWIIGRQPGQYSMADVLGL